MAIDPQSIGIPMSARPLNDPRLIDGLAGLEAAHGALTNGIDSIYKLSYELSGSQILKNFDLPTIGSQIFDGNSSASNFIRQFDPNNSSGAVGFGLKIVDQINSQISGDKLFKDLFGPQITCLVNSFTDISNVIPKIQIQFPDIAAILKDKLREIQNAISSTLDRVLQPINNLLLSLTDVLRTVDDLIQKIGACANAN
jgi:hypothetical protein